MGCVFHCCDKAAIKWDILALLIGLAWHAGRIRSLPLPVYLFDRYLLREWFQIIALVLTALVGLLLVNIMYSDLPKLMNSGAGLMDVTVYMAVAVPGFLAQLIPLTLLVSTLYCFGQMHRNHEFTALRAAGVSILRISLPIWIVGLLCCGLSWWLNSGIVPWSVEEASRMKEQLRFREQSGRMPPDRIGAQTGVSFDNRAEGRLWFMNRYSSYTRKAYGLTLSLLDESRREHTRIVAATAFANGPGAGWTLQDGRTLRFDIASGEITSNQPFKTKILPELDEDPTLMLLIDRKKVSDLSFPELQRLISHLDSIKSPKIIPYQVRYHGLLASILSPLVVIGLAIPFAVSGVRVNPAVGISKSLGLFVVYYLLSQIGASLAAQGWIDPMTAAWIPNIAMVGLASRLFYKLC